MAAAQAGNINAPNILDNLKKAAQDGNINELYAAIRSRPDILEHIDGIPFVDTPLHEAASTGQTNFALEIMSLKPSFGKKLNPDGLSPLDLALNAGHFNTVERLIKLESELIRVKGKGRRTPLHYVSEKHDQNDRHDHHIYLLVDFLRACPASIRDLTIRDETAMHIAVKSSNIQAFKVYLAWLLKTNQSDVLKWKDEEGNTLLHSAVLNKQPKMVELLVNEAEKIIDERNSDGFTALDIALKLEADEANTAYPSPAVEVVDILRGVGASEASSLPKHCRLPEFLISPENFYNYLGRIKVQKILSLEVSNLSPEMSNTLLVVAVLVATATYQAVISPPGASLLQGGGNPPTNNTSYPLEGVAPFTTNAGKVGRGWFTGFYWLNTIAFTFSIAIIIAMVLQWRRYSIALHVSLISLMASYVMSFFLLSRLGFIDGSLLIVASVLAFYGYWMSFASWIMEFESADDVTNVKRGWLQVRPPSSLQRMILSAYLRISEPQIRRVNSED